ncbi:uncharacterized protein LOC143883913 [Tasmannia lanceolata]|uniref:uncharacterized protein LOC143883913 n=1 Tax=Tasmannia lanceolata TaxID=3420 RepID=UPI004063CC39
MKECELCDYPARMFCESDQASLCWDCDAKVHGANFLVERHSRNLLCQVCQSPTPWKASGSKLTPTVSICERCNGRQERTEAGREDEGEEEEEDDDEDDDDDDDVGEEEEEEEDGDNQVVPWSSTPPPVASPSSSEESTSLLYCDGEASMGTTIALSSKRMRENADLNYQDDLGCSSSRPRTSAEDETISFGHFKPLKDRKTTEMIRSSIEAETPVSDYSRSALIGSLKRFQQEKIFSGEKGVASAILDICKLSKDP